MSIKYSCRHAKPLEGTGYTQCEKGDKCPYGGHQKIEDSCRFCSVGGIVENSTKIDKGLSELEIRSRGEGVERVLYHLSQRVNA
ncbi:hypothetical protein J4425_00400 [Candidatus Woesearchaeota archaeon]|nr:hypothetical protein [uncultured archaeon]AQS33972.1 hypothetical protein [uncultured archaeon]MBS3150255.1 hypothetical protein [Candidatus Woesearchaeota archaeon]